MIQFLKDLGKSRSGKQDAAKIAAATKELSQKTQQKIKEQRDPRRRASGVDQETSRTKTAAPGAAQAAPQKEVPNGLGRVRNIIAVASGKGGVGKSTTAVAVAQATAKLGLKVGLVDGDIYGPSVQHMVGGDAPTKMNGMLVVPSEKDGVKSISAPMFNGRDKANVLRGPMAAQLFKQFLTQVDWGELDYLFVDMPPGTGDIQITLGQAAQVTGAVIVTTPQNLALIDVEKSIRAFQVLKVPVLGVIENMSYFVCDNCTEKHYLFGQGGGKDLAKTYSVPLLGEIPILKEIQGAGDRGQSMTDNVALEAFKECSEAILRRAAEQSSSAGNALDSFHLIWRS